MPPLIVFRHGYVPDLSKLSQGRQRQRKHGLRLRHCLCLIIFLEDTNQVLDFSSSTNSPFWQEGRRWKPKCLSRRWGECDGAAVTYRRVEGIFSFQFFMLKNFRLTETLEKEYDDYSYTPDIDLRSANILSSAFELCVLL